MSIQRMKNDILSRIIVHFTCTTPATHTRTNAPMHGHARTSPRSAPLTVRFAFTVTDCLTDRQAVMEEQRAASSVLYIPECTDDGRYNKLQCYNSTGYCWCVHEDTGKPIPGTSVKDKRPACDALAPSMKGEFNTVSLTPAFLAW